MNSAIGPEVSGSASSQPLVIAPQRRPAKLADAMRSGVRTNLGARKLTARRYSPRGNGLYDGAPESAVARWGEGEHR
jgi:hypothetical protein